MAVDAGGAQAWLRQTQRGICMLPAPLPADAIDGCAHGGAGRFLLHGDIRTWPAMAEECMRMCAACERCRYLALPSGHNQCWWFRRCDMRSLELGLFGQSFRTGAVQPSSSLSLVSTSERNRAVLPTPSAWLHGAQVGSCGRSRWFDYGDCEFGPSGSFSLNALDLASPESASHACIEQCGWCTGCQRISLSLEYGVCSWYRSCVLSTKLYPRGMNGSKFISGPVPKTLAAGSSQRREPRTRPEDADADLATRRLILVTTTYANPKQLRMLQYCARQLSGQANLLWIVVEDAATTNPAVAQLLNRTRIPHAHLAVGPTRHKGHEQRNAAFELIVRNRWSGVVYNMDDDNYYHRRLWPELRRLGPRRVGAFAVLIDRAGFVERPMYDARGRFRGFNAGWCYGGGWTAKRFGPRHFCIDMGAFAFDAALLWEKVGRPWDYPGRRQSKRLRAGCGTHVQCPEYTEASRVEWRGGESEFIESLLPNGFPEDLQPLGNCGHDVLVYHNGYSEPPPDVMPGRTSWGVKRWKAFCKSDGW